MELDPLPAVALGRLLKLQARTTLTIDPALADAMSDGQGSFEIAELSEQTQAIRLSLALALALGEGALSLPPRLLYDLTEAAAGFAEAAPWRWFDGDQPMRLTIEHGGRVESFEMSVLGQAGETFGVALYPKTGAIESLRTDDDGGLADLDTLALTLDDEPTWVGTTVEAVFGIALVPCPLKLERGRPALIDEDDLMRLVVALLAAAQLRRRSTRVEQTHEAPDGGEIRVRLDPKPSESARPIAEAKVGRNSRCPCGSGKKYKRCCMRADQAAQRSLEPEPAGPSDEARATLDVLAWILDAHPAVLDAFADACGESVEERPQLLIPVFVHCFALDDGRTPLTRYLEQAPSRRTRAHAHDLERNAGGWLSVWEVLAVDPGRGLRVLDLLTGTRADVRDVSASRSVRPRAVLLGRVVPREDHAILDGVDGHMLEPDRVEDLLAAVRRGLRVRAHRIDVDKLRPWPAVQTLLSCWRELTEHQPVAAQAEVRTTDGEPIEETCDRYAVPGIEVDTLADRLCEDDRVLDDGEDDGSIALSWTRFGNPIHRFWLRTVVGELRLARGELIVRAQTPSRADEIRAELESQLGEQIAFEHRSVAPPRVMRAIASGGIMLDAHPCSLPPEVLARAGYRDRLREIEWYPQKFLDGLSGREAMTRAPSRRTLHRQLCVMEMRADDAADLAEIGALRARLGLADDGSRTRVARSDRELGFGCKASQTLLDLAFPVLCEPLDDDGWGAVLHAAELVWNLDEPDTKICRTMMLSILTKGGISSAMAERYADMLVERRRLFDGDRRIFRIESLSLDDGINLRVETRAPQDVIRRWRRATARPS